MAAAAIEEKGGVADAWVVAATNGAGKAAEWCGRMRGHAGRLTLRSVGKPAAPPSVASPVVAQTAATRVSSSGVEGQGKGGGNECEEKVKNGVKVIWIMDGERGEEPDGLEGEGGPSRC